MDEQALLSFGLWIKRRRRALDLTQEELARRVGCATGTIKKIEGDARRPSHEIATLLATHLQLALEDRANFIRCARAILAPDHLPSPTASTPHAGFVTAQTAAAAFTPAILPHGATTFPFTSMVGATRLTNLPAQPTPLIGRERDLAHVTGLLARPDVRLVTLTGAGGTGKTRLGMQVAGELLGAFADGVFFVDLAPVSDPELVGAAIVQALGVQDAGNLPIRTRLMRFVQARMLLLLLDNYEQVLAAAPLVAELLAAAPGLKMLVTSRVVLHLSGEHEYAVPPLALPPTDDGRRMTDDHARGSVVGGQSLVVGQYAAVQLFIARAQAAKADFALTNANANAVAEICVRLDGLPLAIELAATRVKLFAAEALLARLSTPLALLTGGARDLPARQQTIRSTIGWSYALLSADEQARFRRLGVFTGGFTLDAADTVTALNVQTFERSTALNELATLVDHSLIVVLEPVAGEPRYGMLELVHEYALEQLLAAGEETVTRGRHAAYLLEWVEAVAPRVGGMETRVALEQLAAELPNIRAALVWAGEAGQYDQALRLAVALLPLWLYHGHRDEGSAMLRTALSRPGAGPPITRAWALGALGRLWLGDADHNLEMVPALEESLAIFRALGDLDGSAEMLDHLASGANLRGDSEQAMARYTESLRDGRAAQNKERTAWALHNLASLAFQHRDDARGNALLDESRALFDELEKPAGRAFGLLVLARAVHRRGDGERALELMTESVGLLREQGQTAFLAWALFCLGRGTLREANPTGAANLLAESLAIYRQIGESETTPLVLNLLGEAARARGDHAAARAHFRESRALCRELGNTWDAAGTLLGEGHVALAEGDVDAAHECYAQALKIFAGLPDWDSQRRRTGVAACLAGLAGVAAHWAPERAARQLSAAAALRELVGRAALAQFDVSAPLPPNSAVDKRVLETVRAALSEAAFQAAWVAGQQMTLEQAVAEG